MIKKYKQLPEELRAIIEILLIGTIAVKFSLLISVLHSGHFLTFKLILFKY